MGGASRLFLVVVLVDVVDVNNTDKQVLVADQVFSPLDREPQVARHVEVEGTLEVVDLFGRSRCRDVPRRSGGGSQFGFLGRCRRAAGLQLFVCGRRVLGVDLATAQDVGEGRFGMFSVSDRKFDVAVARDLGNVGEFVDRKVEGKLGAFRVKHRGGGRLVERGAVMYW